MGKTCDKCRYGHNFYDGVADKRKYFCSKDDAVYSVENALDASRPCLDFEPMEFNQDFTNELYAALKSVIEWVEVRGIKRELEMFWGWQAIQAAIAKAEGRT